ncbi:MAG: YihY family protein [Sedimentibacter sp.]|nr:YihY family protein [Sedimentibacter sp.]
MIKKTLMSVMKLLNKTIEDNIFALSAQFSYFIILGIFPFLIFAISLLCSYSEYIYYLLNTLSSFMPEDVYKIVYNIVSYAINSCSKSYLSLSMLVLLWSATSGSATIISGINRAYGFTAKRHFLFLRLEGIVFAVAIMTSMQVIFALVVAGRPILIYLQDITIYKDLNYLLIHILRYAVPFILLFLLFSAAYKFLGALFAAIAMITGSYFYSRYASTRFMYYNSIYGNLSGVFVFIIWIYILSIIFLMGAEVNYLVSKSKKCK